MGTNGSGNYFIDLKKETGTECIRAVFRVLGCLTTPAASRQLAVALLVLLAAAAGAGIIAAHASAFGQLQRLVFDGATDVAIRRSAIGHVLQAVGAALLQGLRSEERRVGEEGRSRWSPYH